jgi:hypothetical protein
MKFLEITESLTLDEIFNNVKCEWIHKRNGLWYSEYKYQGQRLLIAEIDRLDKASIRYTCKGLITGRFWGSQTLAEAITETNLWIEKNKTFLQHYDKYLRVG